MENVQHPLNEEVLNPGSTTPPAEDPQLDPQTIRENADKTDTQEEDKGKDKGDDAAEIRTLLEKVQSQLQESQKFNGRLSNELGELRKENRELRDGRDNGRDTKEAPAVDPSKPKMPNRDDFESQEEYEEAMGNWAVDRNRWQTSKEAAEKQAADIEKAWHDTGWPQEEIDEILNYWNKPENTTPQELRLLMELRTGTRESRLEAIEKLSRELQRGGAPSSSGIGDSHRQDLSEEAVGAEEAASFRAAMNEPNPARHQLLVEAHSEKFGRFVKP